MMPLRRYFLSFFLKLKKIEKQGEETPYDDLISWFFNRDGFELLDADNDATYRSKLDEAKPLDVLINDYQPEIDPRDVYFEKEFILWGLVQFKKLSKYRYSEGMQFQDPYGRFIKGI